MFEELHQQFDSNTRSRLIVMRSALESLDIDSLFRHFHGLAGLGATYMRPALSELAMIGDRETHPYRNGGTPAEEQRRRWRELIDQMEASMEVPRDCTSGGQSEQAA